MRRKAMGSGRVRIVWRRRTATVASVAGTLVLALTQGPTSTRAAGTTGGTVELISVAGDGSPSDRPSVLPATNADGTVVGFKSDASTLDPTVTNGFFNVYVRDRVGQTTERVSQSFPVGSLPNQNSFPPALDGSGDIVAFGSAANLVAGDFNHSPDLFIFDRTAQTTAIATLLGGGFGGGGLPDLPPAVSIDGSLVVFTSSAGDLVNNDNNEVSDVFVYDRNDHTISLISVATVGAAQGKAANAASIGGSISHDGCIVAFVSDATNLSPQDTDESCDVFVRDRCNGATERIAKETQGACKTLGFLPAVSADGSLVAFASDAADLVAGDNNGATDVFVFDRKSRTITLVSKTQTGEEGSVSAAGASQAPSLSASGRFVAFQSAAADLGPTNGKTQVFVADLTTGQLELLSVAASGDVGNNDSTAPQISADGVTVVFQSDATNLVPNDTNGVTDVFAIVNELSFTATPTATSTVTVTPTVTSTSTPITPTATATGPTTTPTVTPTGPTPTATAGDSCGAVCQAGQTCRRQVGGQVLVGVCLPESDCVCFVAGTPSPTPTATGPTQTPTGPTATATGPTATATGPTVTPTHRGGGGGGGGCSCRIDPQSGQVGDSLPLPALMLPVAVWVWRSRRRGG